MTKENTNKKRKSITDTSPDTLYHEIERNCPTSRDGSLAPEDKRTDNAIAFLSTTPNICILTAAGQLNHHSGTESQSPKDSLESPTNSIYSSWDQEFCKKALADRVNFIEKDMCERKQARKNENRIDSDTYDPIKPLRPSSFSRRSSAETQLQMAQRMPHLSCPTILHAQAARAQTITVEALTKRAAQLVEKCQEEQKNDLRSKLLQRAEERSATKINKAVEVEITVPKLGIITLPESFFLAAATASKQKARKSKSNYR